MRGADTMFPYAPQLCQQQLARRSATCSDWAALLPARAVRVMAIMSTRLSQQARWLARTMRGLPVESPDPCSAYSAMAVPWALRQTAAMCSQESPVEASPATYERSLAPTSQPAQPP